MPSNRDSSRPGQPGKRRVLRKIEPTGAPVTIRPPPRASVPAAEEIPLPLLQRAVAPRAETSTVSAIARPTSSSPPPGGTYTSVAPVVATVITPLGTTLDPPPPPRRSTVRGVVLGAALGLAIVGAFVAGSRLAMRAPGAPAVAAAANPGAPVMAAATPVVPAAQPHQAGEAFPVVAATQLPIAPPLPKTRPHRGGKPRAPAPEQPAPGEVAVAPAPSASAAQAPEPAPPAPDDSAQSLVPVIPTPSPAPVDPFVKAVQTDIDEDTARHR